jgi:hypothetical protein
MKPPLSCLRILALLTLAATTADAHVFAQPYTLPVPFTIYALAATGALLLSFVLVGLFAAAPSLGQVRRSPGAFVPTAGRGPHPCVTLGRVVSVSLLGLCTMTGFIGSQNAFANFNVTFFWIGFVLGMPYVVALAGDFYAPVNPWKALTLWLEAAADTSFDGRIPYPAWLGYTPALLLYVAFIWLELFGQLHPRGLSGALAIYTLLNLFGAYLFGKQAWFRYGEFFGVFLRLIGKMSPRARPWDPDEVRSSDGGRRWRAPFTGLLDEPATDLSLVLFILFMLSSTSFDGLHSTLPWVSVYWKEIYPNIAPWLKPSSGKQYELSTQIYYVWQWLSLAVSPLAYLAVFASCAWVMKVLARAPLTARQLVLRFATTLVPIAFVYHVTHYYTELLAQAGQLVKLVSDPFGFGWNLFGTAQQTVGPVMLDVGVIWITQVVLILFGHVVSVYLAHVEALRVFACPRRAVVSQLPMLGLMMIFTNFGLWILSLPLAGS